MFLHMGKAYPRGGADTLPAMSDDWRPRIDLGDSDAALGLERKLEAGVIDHDLKAAFHDRIAVTHSDAEVFAYTDTRERAERAEAVIRTISKENGWGVDAEVARWHATAEAWEAPDVPLPDGDAARAEEHAELVAREKAEAAASGIPEFEVRIECPSHREMMDVAGKLRGEGFIPVHRWRYALVGMPDEDSAAALAERLRGELPPGGTATAEGTWKKALAEAPSNPFSVFGGLGV